MKRRLQMAAVFVLLLSGCKMGKNYRGTDVAVPDSFRFESAGNLPVDSIINSRDTMLTAGLEGIEWFGLFNDPVLDSLVKQALSYNYDLKIAAENILQATYGLGVQRSYMLPGVGLQAGANRSDFNGFMPTETQNIFYGLGFVNWELDFYGKYRRLNEAARARIFSSEEGYRAVKLSLISTVAVTYFTLLENKWKLEIAESNVAARDSMLKIIEMRFERGVIPLIDVNQAQINKYRAAEQVPVYKRNIAMMENMLSFLTGTNPRAIATGVNLESRVTEIEIPAGLPGHLLLRRPDVVAAEYELVAQNATAGAAKANRFPNISLTGMFGAVSNDLSSFGTGELAWSISGSILGPLFNWRRFQRQVDIELSKTEQAVFNYEKTVIEAFRSVEDALISISTLKEELAAREALLKAAFSAQDLALDRYNQGVTSYLEYLEIQNQAFRTEIDYASTKQQLLSAYTELYKALGGGW